MTDQNRALQGMRHNVAELLRAKNADKTPNEAEVFDAAEHFETIDALAMRGELPSEWAEAHEAKLLAKTSRKPRAHKTRFKTGPANDRQGELAFGRGAAWTRPA